MRKHPVCAGPLRAAFVLCALCSLAVGRPRITIQEELELPRREIKRNLPPYPDQRTDSSMQSWTRRAEKDLSRLYRERGYMGAGVTVSAQRTDQRWEVSVGADEGGQFTFGRVRVRDMSSADSVLVDTTDLAAAQGATFSWDVVYKDRSTISAAYRSRGFLHARVEDSIDYQSHENVVNVTYAAYPGLRVVADTVHISAMREDTTGVPGLTRSSRLLSLVDYEPGDTATQKKHDRIVEKLQATGVFNYIRISDTLLSSSPPHRLIIVKAQERVPGSFRTNIFYETQYGPGLSVAIEHDNVSGILHHLGAHVEFALRKQGFALSHAAPVLFGTLVRLENEFKASWRQLRKAHDSLGTPPLSGDAEVIHSTQLSRKVNRHLRLIGQGEVLYRKSEFADSTRLRGLNLNLVSSAPIRFIDDPLAPKRGYAATLIWGNGGPIVTDGVDVQRIITGRHNWIEARNAVYIPIVNGLRMATRVNAGTFWGDAGINAERFYLGGSRSVRSFGFAELCPSDDTPCFPQPGESPAYYLGSLELRFLPFSYGAFDDSEGFLKTLQGLQVVPFVDYGKVWDRSYAFGKQNTGEGYAYGGGLRYPLFGIFNLRFDLAWGHNGLGERAFAWVLDIGQAF